MALIHRATLRPTKVELLTGWLPTRNWHTGPAGDVDWVAAYRFDDPAGEVGVETLLVRVAGGPVHQVPLTYRAAPLTDGADRLIGTCEHSVLGTRWVYDAIGDPVHTATLTDAIRTGTGQADQFTEVDGKLEPRAPTMDITVTTLSGPVPRGAGDDPVLVVTDTVELAVVRDLSAGHRLTGAVLTGTWPGQATPVPLASANPLP